MLTRDNRTPFRSVLAKEAESRIRPRGRIHVFAEIFPGVLSGFKLQRSDVIRLFKTCMVEESGPNMSRAGHTLAVWLQGSESRNVLFVEAERRSE